MTDWLSLTCSDDIEDMEWTLAEEFIDSTALRSRPDAAVFKRANDDGSATFFFPPACQSLGKSKGATACEAPKGDALNTAVGDASAYDKLFG